MLIRIRFFWVITCWVTLVTTNWFQILLYIKNISSTFAIFFRRWSWSSVCHSSLFIANISVSGILFFPSTIFCIAIGADVGGNNPCCLLYQFWKKIAFAKILNSKTCNTVNKVNFRLICVEVFNWGKLKVIFSQSCLKCFAISWKNVCMVIMYTIKQ